MPAYKLHGPLVYFACFKNHLGLYALPDAVLAFQEALAGFETSKGTVRFPHDKPLPAKLIAEIVKYRVKKNEEKAAANRKEKKTTSRT